ncbi:hypothetical protein AB1Y20_020608 [Prymnesium parvum]|uniref:HSF-type DNA-binding domain-containing protein n=1 Tax=Prymnesium parvum TaxID=97485 RepID=A0AB34JV20_PRYPA
MASSDAALTCRPAGCQVVVAREPPFQILAASPTWLAISGYTDTDAVGQPLLQSLEGEATCRATAAALASAIQESKAIVVRMVVYRKDGAQLYAEIESVNIPQPLSALAGPSSCVLHFTVANSSLQRHPKPTGDSLNLNHPSLSSSAHICVENRTPWRILACNKLWETLTGYSPEDNMKSTLSVLHGPVTDEATMVALRDAFTQQRPISARLVCYDSAQLPFLATVHASPLPEYDSVLLKLLPSVSSDIGESSQALQQAASSQGVLANASCAPLYMGPAFGARGREREQAEAQSMLTTSAVHNPPTAAGKRAKPDTSPSNATARVTTSFVNGEEHMSVDAASTTTSEFKYLGTENFVSGNAKSWSAQQAVLMERVESNLTDAFSEGGDDTVRVDGRTRTDKPAPFVSKLLQILQTPENEPVVHWAVYEGAPAFTIEDTTSFSKSVLPQYFKHNKLSSFVQQLYTYGFRRCGESMSMKRSLKAPEFHHRAAESSSSISFLHDLFRPSQPELLAQIKRGNGSKDVSPPSAAGISAAGMASSSTDDIQIAQQEMDQLERTIELIRTSHGERLARDSQWVEAVVRMIETRTAANAIPLGSAPRPERARDASGTGAANCSASQTNGTRGEDSSIESHSGESRIGESRSVESRSGESRSGSSAGTSSQRNGVLSDRCSESGGSDGSSSDTGSSQAKNYKRAKGKRTNSNSPPHSETSIEV